MAEYIDTSVNPADYIEAWEAEDAEHGKQIVMAVDDLKCLPTADVRSVVLCKDCDLWNEWDSSGRESLGTYRCSCAEWTTKITTYYTGPDEFCSRGVRRDSDG